MKTAIVLNALLLDELALHPLRAGAHTLDRALQWACSLAVSDSDPVLLLTNDTDVLSAPQDVRIVRIDRRAAEGYSFPEILKTIEIECAGISTIIYAFADSPFLDAALTERMLETHRRNFCQYSFADGFPQGLAPELVEMEILPTLIKRGEGVVLSRTSFFDVIQKDINLFDIETEISPIDLRLDRLALHADTPGRFDLLDRLSSLPQTDAATLTRLLEENRTWHRTRPAYYSIQTTARCPQKCTYCPYPKIRPDCLDISDEMPLARFRILVDEIADFSRDAWVSPSLWGEPSLCGAIDDMILEILKHPRLQCVVETSGIGWNVDRLEALSRAVSEANSTASLRRLTWIVSLDASEAALYERLRGRGFEEAIETAEHLLSLFPGQTYLQTVRMTETEGNIEDFFKTWSARTPNVIIQKYDSYCGFLPEKKITDLSPLKRFPCWHLKRDFCVRLDGTVPLCRESLDSSSVLGNVFNDGIRALWAKGQALYERQCRDEYPGLCGNCDEYYTYNF